MNDKPQETESGRQRRNPMLPFAAAFCTMCLVLMPGNASGALISWTDWTSGAPGNPSSAEGMIDQPGVGIISVNYSGEIDPATQVSGGGNWGPAPGGRSPYTNSVVGNAPTSDHISITGGNSTVNRITFSVPVDDPIMAVLSLGQNNLRAQYLFDRAFTVLSSGPNCCWPSSGVLTALPGDVLEGEEGNGTIQFPGRHTSISWTVPIGEFWHGFTIGLPPPCTCPSNITANAALDDCSAVVTFCTTNCIPASGSQFQIGTTTVNCTTPAGTTNCSFTVTVRDVQGPRFISCPGTTMTNTAPGRCDAVINYIVPDAEDCSGFSVVCMPPSGSTFPRGSTQVICIATDTAGNTNRCAFFVFVQDNQPPTITCPGSLRWEFRAPFADPNNRGIEGSCASLIGDKIYVSHGLRTGDSALLSVYDIPSNTWTHGGTNAPNAAIIRSELAGGTALGKHYALGGRTGPTAANEEFDPATRTWRTRAPLSLARGGLAAASYQDKIYALGGRGQFGVTNIAEEYNPVSNVWRRLAPMPVAVSDHYATVALNGRIYVFGGALFWPGVVTNVVQIYDITNNTWTLGRPMPTRRAAAMAGVIGGRIAVFGGYNGANLSVTEIYDPATDRWTPGPSMLRASSEMAQGVTFTGTEIYAIGSGINGAAQTNVQVLIATGQKDVIFDAEPGRCYRGNVTFTPTFTDNCGTNNLFPFCSPQSGSTFQVGNTPVTCQVYESPYTVTCSFVVTVRDVERPFFRSCFNIVRTLPPGQCEMAVSYQLGPADNCIDTGGQGGLTVTCMPPSGSVFLRGTTPVTCIATDAAGNSTNCAFTVTVSLPPTGPVVLMGIDAEDVHSGGGHGPITTWQTLVSNIVTKARGGTNGILVIGGGKNPNDEVTHFWQMIRTGITHNVTFVNGNAIASQSFTNCRMLAVVSDYLNTGSGGLTVAENNLLRDRAQDIANFVHNGGGLLGFSSEFTRPPPGAAGPYAYMTGLGGVTLGSVDYADIDATPAGVAIGVNDSLDVVAWHQYFASFPSYLGVLAYVAGTTNRPAAIGGPNVNVFLTCPSPVVVPCPSASVTLTAQVFNAECRDLNVIWTIDGVAVQTNIVPANSLSPKLTNTWLYTAGVHYVTVSFEGGGLSPQSCTTIVFVDDAPPAISCPDLIVTNTEPGRCSAVVSFSPVATDACSGVTNVTCLPPSGSRFDKGTHEVICSALDAVGHEATCRFQIVIQDLDPPLLVCPPDIVTNAPPGQNGVVVNFSASATDNCGEVVVVCEPPSGSTFSNSTTMVWCTATDAAANTNRCSFTVTLSGCMTITPMANMAVCAGQPATFNIVAGGSGPFTYAWTFDGRPIGANEPALTVATNRLGDYIVTVFVTNQCGSASNSAILTVGASMTAAGPTNLTRCICESALFSTVVSGGAGPAHFVWKANGRLLEGETNRMLLLQNLKETNAGLYTVEVNGPCNSVTNSATLTVEGTLQNPLIIDNPASIAINDHPVTSSPYPSKINVKCVPGILTNLIVILRGFSHEFPDDVDIMLVSPAGRGVKLMSDAAGGEPVTGLSLTFNDAATSSLPDEDESLLVSGVFRVTDYESNDSLPAPAPSGPYATNLTALTGIVPNGMWSLYVFDDARGDAGGIASGWSLRLSWQPTPPSLSAPIILPDGRTRMTVNSLAGLTYVVEASTDLETWVAIGTNTVSGTTFDYIDAEGWNHSRRFYRVIRCP